jgi:hypothetical protein
MQGSKQYFDIGRFIVDGAESLARALSGKTWSKIREHSSIQLAVSKERANA